MRVLPVALATLGQDDEAVRAAVRAQAHVTHHNAALRCRLRVPRLHGAGCLAWREVCAKLYRQRIQPLVAAHPEFAFRPRRRENPSGWVVETLQAVLQALLDTDSFEDCLIDVVNRGGDADTTGAIAGMLAGALYGPAALPTAGSTGARSAGARALHDASARAGCIRSGR